MWSGKKSKRHGGGYGILSLFFCIKVNVNNKILELEFINLRLSEF